MIPLGGRTRVALELEGGMGRSLTPEPGSVPAVGEPVTYTTLRDDFQPLPRFPEQEDTPWTHGGPPPPRHGTGCRVRQRGARVVCPALG